MDSGGRSRFESPNCVVVLEAENLDLGKVLRDGSRQSPIVGCQSGLRPLGASDVETVVDRMSYPVRGSRRLKEQVFRWMQSWDSRSQDFFEEDGRLPTSPRRLFFQKTFAHSVRMKSGAWHSNASSSKRRASGRRASSANHLTTTLASTVIPHLSRSSRIRSVLSVWGVPAVCSARRSVRSRKAARRSR